MSDKNEAETLWAWVTLEPSGDVSQVGGFIPGMPGVTPLIHRNRDLIESLRPLAAAHRQRTGQRVWLREYRMVADHGKA